VAELLGKEGINLYVWDFGVNRPRRERTRVEARPDRNAAKDDPARRTAEARKNSRREKIARGGRPTSPRDATPIFIAGRVLHHIHHLVRLADDVGAASAHRAEKSPAPMLARTLRFKLCSLQKIPARSESCKRLATTTA